MTEGRAEGRKRRVPDWLVEQLRKRFKPFPAPERRRFNPGEMWTRGTAQARVATQAGCQSAQAGAGTLGQGVQQRGDARPLCVRRSQAAEHRL